MNMSLAKSEERTRALHGSYSEAAQFAQNTQGEIYRLEEALRESESNQATLKDSYVECNEKLASYASLHRHQELELERYDRLLREAEDLASSAESRFLATHNNLQHLQAEHDRRLQENTELQDSLRFATQALHLSEASFRDKSESFQEKLAELETAHAVEVNDYELRLRSVVSEVESNKRLISSTQREAEEMKSVITDQSERTRAAEELIGRKEEEVKELHTIIGSLQNKCTRLREYIRKMTSKCDEWEVFNDKQSNILDKLKLENERTRQKAAKLVQRCFERDLVRLSGSQTS
jgi:chromosome segregation ATPase